MISTILDPIMYLKMKIRIRTSLEPGDGDLLHNDHDCPNREGWLLPEAIEEYLCHRLVTVDEGLQVWSHTKCERHVDSWKVLTTVSMRCAIEREDTHPSPALQRFR